MISEVTVMSDFFEDIKKRISDTAEDLGKKADEVIAVQGLRSQKRSAKRAINEQYIELGRIVYGKYQDGSVEIAEEAVPFCEMIKELFDKIEAYDQEIEERRSRMKTDKNGEEDIFEAEDDFFEEDSDEAEEAAPEDAASEESAAEDASKEDDSKEDASEKTEEA